MPSAVSLSGEGVSYRDFQMYRPVRKRVGTLMNSNSIFKLVAIFHYTRYTVYRYY